MDGYSGDDCSIFPCLNGCSGHGACYNGTCACDFLYVGEDCSVYEGYLVECPGNCTGRGACMNATCHCDPGWTDLDCSASIDCPGNCTGHGMCYNATCACDLGFSGFDCAQAHCLNNCTMHGACTSNGTCACDPSWHGSDCSLPDLTCGVGFFGNCSGHGTCLDSASNQWWSGNSKMPDMWAWEEPSKHLVRRDVELIGDLQLGHCDVDFYGVPVVIENRAVMAFAQEERVMQSNGVPEHFVINNGFPMCEVAWSVSVRLHPRVTTGPCNYKWAQGPRDAICPRPSPLPQDSPIGYSLNGVPIWGAILSDGSNAVEGLEPVPCYGHSSRTGMWHYHHPILGCNMAANQETLLGYALDGFAIYGPFSGSKEDVDGILDKCNGRALEDGSYRYHVRTLAQVDESMAYQDESKDPRNPMGETAHNNWNYVLGCFSGRPSSSLGLRQVIVPLMGKSDNWISEQDNSAMSSDSLADQLGLTARIGLCMCDAGWVGSDCRTLGCLNNCSGNGFCEANETSAHCSCDRMFEGEDCSKRINTTCSIGCSGHGTCLWEDYLNATCLCDPAWGGSNCQDLVGPPCPYNCSGHGSCYNNTCTCDHMYEGSGCEQPSTYALNLNATLCWQYIGHLLTNNSCAGRGTCFNGTCICDAGWTGVNCTAPNIPNPVYVDCPNNCSFHGACVHIFDEAHVTYNGTCVCDMGFDGPDCAIDWGAHQCDGNCSAHGSCVNKTCICDPGWDGYDCNEPWVSPYLLCPMNCSDHGSCFNGTCSCDLGWYGANCSLPDPCPGDCSGHGVCSLGNCTCDPEWAGADCSHASYCPGFVAELGVNCSGHGVCIGGNCSCDLQWGGFDCSVPGCINSCSNNGICRNGTCDCFVGFIGNDCGMGPYSGECPGQCSGNGACSIVESVTLPYGVADVRGGGRPVPMSCDWLSGCVSTKGRCGVVELEDQGGRTASLCGCSDGYREMFWGNVCAQEHPEASRLALALRITLKLDGVTLDRFNTTFEARVVASLAQGSNVREASIIILSVMEVQSQTGVRLFVDVETETPEMLEHDLSGHGLSTIFLGNGLPAVSDVVMEIVDPVEEDEDEEDGVLSATIACVCDEGWDGADCTIRSCPNDCSGNGACAQNGTCFCYRNWGGEDCSTAWCPNACNNRGTCVGGQGCLCDVGYDGLDCGISACPNNCTGRGVCLASPGIEYDGTRHCSDLHDYVDSAGRTCDDWSDNPHWCDQRPERFADANGISPDIACCACGGGARDAEKGYDSIVNKTSSGCMCFYGWGGDDCATVSCPLNCSFPNGYCNNGTCACDMDLGYYGRNCSEKFGVVSLRTDGKALTPSYGIFEGRTIVTVRGTGFVNSDTMRCKFGSKLSPAQIVVPNPPEVPYALCLSVGELSATPDGVFFQFTLDGLEYTLADSRIKFIYHGNGIVTGVRWPTGPEQGGTTVTFFGINFQFALGVQCAFGDFIVGGSFNIRFIEDPVSGGQVKEAQLMCMVPALAALNLDRSAGASVELQVSMNMGQNWMRYESDYFFKYYGATRVSPSFGPQQDQNTEILFYGFNFFQGEGRKDLFPGFEYDYTCVFYLPWADSPVQVRSLTSTWISVTAPIDGARFGCTVPPGLVGESGYTGPVDVGLSLNPCIYDPTDTNKEYGCIDSLPFTTESVVFYYVENTVNSLSITYGPSSGGTVVTISGNHFERRDLSDLPSNYEHPPILCKWGTVVTEGTYIVQEQTVQCSSPTCVSSSCMGLDLSTCPSCIASLPLEVALNGQDFTDSRVQFNYYLDPRVQRIYPSLGSILGGTTVTIHALGFHDPCTGCESRSDCSTCGGLLKCKYQAFDRVEYTDAECIKLAGGLCDPTRIKCLSPVGRVLRGNIVSLDPFYVSLSVSINNQQFFPLNPASEPPNEPYNVYDPQCTGSRTSGCAFFFKFYELPILFSVYPTAIGGNGGGRLTITGTNFLNENELRCRYGSVVGPPACQSGATGDFSPISTPGQCVGPVLESPIFISAKMVICGTVDLGTMQSSSGGRVTETSVGVSFNGGLGEFDTSWLPTSSGNPQDDAVQVYWVTKIEPTLGFMAGSTRVTVTGINLEAVGVGGDNSRMRCKFDERLVEPDAQQDPDPVDFSGGKIECTSPASVVTTGTFEVIFGICLIGEECLYTGVARQAESANTLQPEVNHFTKAIKYLYYEAPKLQSLTPSLGPRAGSTYITIAGEGFFSSPVLACRFDLGHYSSASTLVSASQVICKTPPITAGSYNVDISLNGQQFSAGCGVSGRCPFYSYIEPTIALVNPQTGVNTGRTLLLMTVENPVIDFYMLQCKFQAIYPPDQERLEIENFDLVSDAAVSGSSVTCFTPTTMAFGGSPMLHTVSPEKPLQGLTYVSLSWNGQQYGPFDASANTQKFWYHDAVETVSIVPSGGKTSNEQKVTIFGSNFVDTRSLQVQFGTNLFLCAPGAPLTDCPADERHSRDVVVFISSEELHITVPENPNPTTKDVKVSNNGNAQEFSVSSVLYQYYSALENCPNQCKGVAPTGSDGHGKCEKLGTGFGCNCNLGYSGFDCSVGPMVLRLKPSIGLATGGFQVTVIGRNIWTSAVPTTGNTFKALLDNRAAVEATQGTGCVDDAECEDTLVFTVPTKDDDSGEMRVAPGGIPVEITVNGIDYTVNERLLRLMGTPSISSIVPNGAHYTANVRVTIVGSNFIDSDTVRVRLGPMDTEPPCLSELCLRAVFVTSSKIVFTSDPCLANCNFQSPLLVQLALNGVDFIDTGKTFRFLENTTLTKLVPRVGSVRGGTPVVVTASNMNATSGFSCRFGDMAVLGTRNEATGELVCVSPESPGGNATVPVTIALDGQTYSPTPDCNVEIEKCFVYKNPLSASRLYPTLGPIEGGTKLTIYGSNFYDAEGVQGLCQFHHEEKGTFSSHMTLLDSEHFTCETPTMQQFQIQTYGFQFAANGADFEVSTFEFRFYKHPQLVAPKGDTIRPVGSSLLGGTSVTVSGSGFIDSSDGIRVRWVDKITGAIFMSGKVTFVSDEKIVLLTSAYPHALGDRIKADTKLSVSLNDGLDFSLPAEDTFSWYVVPALTEIQPPLGPRLGETAVALLGVGFINLRGVARCRFGDITTLAVYDDSAVSGIPVFRCKSPPWPVPDWVNVEIAMDGQVFTEAKNVKFQYYGEYDILAATPAGGPKAGGTEITVSGVGLFMSGIYLSCFFGDGESECSADVLYSPSSPCYKSVRAVFQTPTKVTCTSPSMPQGGEVTYNYPIRVGLNGQFSQACPNTETAYQCALKSGLAFTYYDDVYVTGLSPNSGQVMGGTELTVYGSGFRTDLASRTRCIFTRCMSTDIYTTGDRVGEFRNPEQQKCTGETVVSPAAPGDVGVISTTQIRCLSPLASTADTHFALFDISLNKGVTNQNFYGPLCRDKCPVLYFYYALPQLASNGPSIGPLIGGTSVTVTGVGFIGTQNTKIRCKFGGVASQSVQFLTETTISCQAPAASAESTIRIQVSLNGLNSDFTLLDLGSRFVYHVDPILLDRPRPSAGPTTGGTFITIVGTGFINGGLSCKFWTSSAKGSLDQRVPAEFLTTSSAMCAAPAVEQSQLVSVSLSLNGQDFSPNYLEDLFYYFPAPQVTRLYPSAGPAQSGGYALVRGQGFIETTSLKCRVGVIESMATFINDTFVRCAVPQIRKKTFSSHVLAIGVIPEVYDDDFIEYPVQAYPLELSFDGQTFSTNNQQYVYYQTPQVDLIAPNSGIKSALTTTAVLNGANFRNDFGGPFCRFGGVGTVRALFLTDRTIRCQLPAVALGKTVIVEVSINGQEYEDHSSTTFSFMGQAPVLEAADLTENFDKIRLIFDVNTNLANQKGTFDCGNILAIRQEDLSLQTSGLAADDVVAMGDAPSPTAMFEALYGRGVSCRFADNRTGLIVMGYDPKFKLGHPVTLREDLFMRGNELTYFTSGNTTIKSPQAAVKPVALVSAPGEIGACDELIIDAAPSAGGLGRGLYYSWILDTLQSRITDDNLTPSQKGAVMDEISDLIADFSGPDKTLPKQSAGDTEISAVCRNPTCLVPAMNGTAAYYQNCFCNVLKVPFAKYPPGRYTVQLQVSNWQGLVSDAASITAEKLVTSIPTVSINLFSGDQDRSLYVNQTNAVGSSAAPSACTSASITLTYKWTVLDDTLAVVDLGSVFLEASTLVLPAYSLVPGKTYSVKLRVTQNTGICQIPPEPPALCQDTDAVKCCFVGSDMAILKTSTSAPVAKILGGERTVSSLMDLEIDGSGSFHPDFSGQAQPTLLYQWTCQDTPSNGVSASGGCLNPLDKSFGSGSESKLVIEANMLRAGSVIYDFTLNVSDATGWSTASIRIHAINADIPFVTVEIQNEKRRYPPNHKVTLMSTVVPSAAAMDSLTYQWSAVQGDVDLTKTRFLLSTNSRGSSLSIKPNVLTAGQLYTVRLTVSENGVLGYDQVSFIVDTPPTGGIFEVSPTSGTSLDTVFKLSAANWQVDADAMPIKYAFDYLKEGSTSVRILQSPSESGAIEKLLPPGPDATSNVWALQARISNMLGSETLVTSCNLAMTATCLVKVVPKTYASTDAMLADVEGRTAEVTNLINSGDANTAVNYINILAQTLNGGGGGGRRRLLSDADIANTKCGTLAPLLFSTLPSAGLIGYPTADSQARNVVATLLSLLAIAAQVNDQCLAEMKKIYDVVIEYAAKATPTIWSSEPDLVLLQDMVDVVSLAMAAVDHLKQGGVLSSNVTATRISTLISQHTAVAAVRSYGSVSGESAKALDSSKMRSKIYRLQAPTSAPAAGRWHRDGSQALRADALPEEPSTGLPQEEVLDDRPGRRLTASSAGTTQLSAWQGSFTQSVFSLPASTLPFAIARVPDVVASNGATLSQDASVSATATHYLNYYNPHFYSSDAFKVIAPVLSLQLQAFGVYEEVVPLTNLASPITLDFMLARVPDATQDNEGRHQVASCAYWDGEKWETTGCSLDRLAPDGSGGWKAICMCNTVGMHTVLDLPAGCDGVPYSTVLFDVCRVCGGDGSSCKGCDGVPNSGAVYDGCISKENPRGVCGGDNSTCAGCDGVPNSGTLLDECSVCGGDNSTCMGCDGVSVHPRVTARTGLRPKAYDQCKSAQNPLGVCGGCDASCKGCDGKINSGKLFDKCGRCGDFESELDAGNSAVGPNDWYSRSNKDNCTLGRKQCAAGFVPDDCGTCIPFGSGPELRNQACQGCDNVAGVFSYQRGVRQTGGKVLDICGVCGGNDCSCQDCKGVVGGTAKYDRCGVCEGNNTCLDCMGTPYGVKVKDVCGICGGSNDTRNCLGCDGRIHPLPNIPPQYDGNFTCCAVSLIGCNNTCYADVGCDGVCSKDYKEIDNCGVCGGNNAPDTGVCDCAAIPNGQSQVGCDGVCRNPPKVLDICGVCGGTNQSETGHCDCEGIPHGPAVKDSSGVCCYLSDMGCGSKNQSRCFSGKTWDICNTCGGDGGTCVQTRPASASRSGVHWPMAAIVAGLLSAYLAFLHRHA